MHELSTCKSLISQLEKMAQEQHAEGRHISNVILSVGELARVDIDELLILFPVAAKGTLAENALLTVSKMPIRINCLDCDEDSDVRADDLACPHCHHENTRLLSGTDMLLTGIEFQD